ncbi:MAG: hypothetical protein VX464_20830 [Pseudomonadota bacterium]|nr:hypothetical protein [Pseudomonadota bacterium]
MAQFYFDGRFHIAPNAWVSLDCEYISHGRDEDPTIRVHGAFTGDNPSKAWTACAHDVERGEPMYETLLAQAEAHGAKCIEADEAFEDQCYRERHATRNDDIRKDRAAVAAE